MRTIACEGYCPFLLLHFLVFIHFTRQILHFSKKGCTSFIKFLKPLYLSIFQQFLQSVHKLKYKA